MTDNGLFRRVEPLSAIRRVYGCDIRAPVVASTATLLPAMVWFPGIARFVCIIRRLPLRPPLSCLVLRRLSRPLLITLLIVRYAASAMKILHRLTIWAGRAESHARPVAAHRGTGILVGDSVGRAEHGSIKPFWRNSGPCRPAACPPLCCPGLVEDLTKRVSPLVRLICRWRPPHWLSFFEYRHVNAHQRARARFPASYAVIRCAVTVLAVGGAAKRRSNTHRWLQTPRSWSPVHDCFESIGVRSRFRSRTDRAVGFAQIIDGRSDGLFHLGIFAGPDLSATGGAYFIGSGSPSCRFMLVMRNRDVSAWYPVLKRFRYRIRETCFSIYRRSLYAGCRRYCEDGVHLHMLVLYTAMRGGGWCLRDCGEI